jgi:ADP-ribose pyrophosphatase YjhB (NUDIX family)
MIQKISECAKSGVGALIISSSTERTLFNLRAPDKSYGLCWSLWGGMIEEGESPKVALLREFSEEMGFVPDLKKLYPFDIYESKDKMFRYYTFIAIVQDEFMPNINHEAVGYSWIKAGIWPKPMHTGARKSLCNTKAEEKIKIILDQHRHENIKL